MKQLLFALLSVLIISCTNEESDKKKDVKQYAPISVRISNFSASVENFNATRASALKDYDKIKSLIVAVYDSNNIEVQRITQNKNDISTNETFGELNFSLPLGDYTLLIIGRNVSSSDAMTLTSLTEAAYTEVFVRETVTATQVLTINSTTPKVLNIELSRIVSKLNIVSTDNRPANATKVRTTYSKGSKSFNPSTGLATNDNGFSVINNPSSNAGATISISSFLFLHEDEETMDVTLDVMDASENILNTCVIKNVPFKRNRVTKLVGELYTLSVASAITVETDWDSELEVNF